MSERYTPPCPYYRRCGGCQLQNMPYSEQLLHKQREAVRLLLPPLPAQQLRQAAGLVGGEHPWRLDTYNDILVRV